MQYHGYFSKIVLRTTLLSTQLIPFRDLVTNWNGTYQARMVENPGLTQASEKAGRKSKEWRRATNFIHFT